MEGLIEHTNGIPSLGVAIEVVVAGVVKAEEENRRESTKSWRKLFSEWSTDVWKLAGSVIKPPCGSAVFTANDMADEWRPRWAPKPEEYDEEESWTGWMKRAKPAFEAGEFPRSSVPEDWLPSEQQFDRAISKSRGAAGLDGWSAMEVKALFRNLPWLKQEIYSLWCDTTRELSEKASEEGSCLGQELEDLLFSWRTVGIPKKDDSSRPIGFVSYLVRVWLSACAESLPQPYWSQWAGRKQTTVVQAVAHWLSVCSELCVGGEFDLSKAYDLLNHRVVQSGLEFEGVPRGIRLLSLEGLEGAEILPSCW